MAPWWDRFIVRDGSAVVRRSAERYVRALTDPGSPSKPARGRPGLDLPEPAPDQVGVRHRGSRSRSRGVPAGRSGSERDGDRDRPAQGGDEAEPPASEHAQPESRRSARERARRRAGQEPRGLQPRTRLAPGRRSHHPRRHARGERRSHFVGPRQTEYASTHGMIAGDEHHPGERLEEPEKPRSAQERRCASSREVRRRC